MVQGRKAQTTTAKTNQLAIQGNNQFTALQGLKDQEPTITVTTMEHVPTKVEETNEERRQPIVIKSIRIPLGYLAKDGYYYETKDVTGSTSEGWGRPIPGPRLRSPLETFEDCVHCSDKYHDSTMCPTTFTLERCPYCSGNRHSPTQCPNIITQAFNYTPRVKADPIPIPPKPEEGAPTSSRYPERAIKPLPRRAREPRP
jgi:hypothetical protein